MEFHKSIAINHVFHSCNHSHGSSLNRAPNTERAQGILIIPTYLQYPFEAMGSDSEVSWPYLLMTQLYISFLNETIAAISKTLEHFQRIGFWAEVIWLKLNAAIPKKGHISSICCHCLPLKAYRPPFIAIWRVQFDSLLSLNDQVVFQNYILSPSIC